MSVIGMPGGSVMFALKFLFIDTNKLAQCNRVSKKSLFQVL